MADRQCLRKSGQQYIEVGGTKLTSQHVSLQVFGMEVGLGAIGARELSVGVFLRNGIPLRRTIKSVLHDGRTSWRTW